MASIDLMKFFLSICVMLLHIHGSIIEYIPNLSLFNKLVSNLAVPLFLIFSGYFFKKSCERKPIIKVLMDNTVRLIMISLIYQSIWILFLNENGTALALLQSSDAKIELILNWLYSYFVDGSYQFWYITSLCISLWLIALFHKFKGEKVLFVFSIVSYSVLMLTSTWGSISNCETLNVLVNVGNNYFNSIYQSCFIALIFVLIGYFFDTFYIYINKYKFLLVVGILMYIFETSTYYHLKMTGLSLWASAPIICTTIFYILIKYPLSILNKYAKFFRHISTIIYCTHYQLAAFMMIGVEDIFLIDRKAMTLKYVIYLSCLTLGLYLVIKLLAKRFKIFNYFY